MNKIQENNSVQIKKFTVEGTQEISIPKHEEQELYIQIKNTATIHIIVEEHATVNCNIIIQEEATLTLHTALQGTHATANINMLSVNNHQEQHMDITVEHLAKNTTSHIENRNLLIGGKTTINGLIIIHKDAAESVGYQQSHTLITERGIIKTIPNLQIHNPNVTCSHGATIATIDEEKKFYITSHGITEEDAEKLIIQGFFATSKIPEEFKAIIKEYHMGE